jgi:DNA-binding IclR family transcriptional regulator
VLLTAAEPILSALRDATGESAQLYLRRADERICVAAAERASGCATPFRSARCCR